MKQRSPTLKALIALLAIALSLLAASVIFKDKAFGRQDPEEVSSPESIIAVVNGFPSPHRPEEILPYSDVVVIARITDIGDARWNTETGKKPKDWHPGLEAEWMIYTPYIFKVEQVLKGSISEGSSSQFAVIGGQVGDDIVQTGDEMGISSYVNIGDQVLLFLRSAEGNMLYVAPYTFGDALRIDGDKAVAECHGSHEVADCQVVFDLSYVLSRVNAHK